MHTMRLAKYLSHAGVCSRRQASRLIDTGKVVVNNRLGSHIDHVSEQDEITVAGERVTGLATKVYFAYHKPVGIDCKLKANDPCSLLHRLPQSPRIYPVGRLDKDSRGLLLLTNDGEFCNQLLHPEHHQEKQYTVTVNAPLNPQFCQKMAAGVLVDKQLTQPCEVRLLNDRQFSIVLRQGLNRQIRKMTKACGYQVVDLLRVRIGHYCLNPQKLPEGQILPISPADILHKK